MLQTSWIFARRSVSELHAESERSGLKRALGPLDLTLMGVGAVIGAGIFGTIGVAAGAAGPAVVLSFVVTAVACGLAGLCYAELTSVVPIAGSAYTYAYATLGQLVAWIIGWDLILEYAIGNVGVAISWADYAWAFMDQIGIHFPLWLAKDPRYLSDPASNAEFVEIIRRTAPVIGGQPICFNLLGVIITFLLTVLLVKGVKESAWANNAIVLLKLAVLLFVIGIGMMYWDTSRWGLMPYKKEVFMPNGWSGVFKAAGLLFFSYIGFDAVSTAAEETKKPARDLPIGILGSLALCTILYIAIGYVATALVPYADLAKEADPLNVAVAATHNEWAKIIVSLGATLSMTAVLLVFQMGQPRILMSMSRDGLLPKRFASVHPKFGTPAFSTILTGAVVAFFSAFANIVEIVNLVNIGTLFAFVVVCAGTMMLRLREPDLHRPFRAPLLWFVGPAGVATCGFLMFQQGAENWSRLGLWLLIGLNVYFAFGYPANCKDPARKIAIAKTANAAFAAALAATGVFLLFGDRWLSGVSAAPDDWKGPDPWTKTIWEKWVGFPSGMAHGLAIFLGVIVVWNLAALVKRARPQLAAGA